MQAYFWTEDFLDKNKRAVAEKIARAGALPIRVWVPGCGTGEEAYAWVALFRKVLNFKGDEHTVRVFASDLKPANLQRARMGLHPEAAGEFLPREIFDDVFVKFDNVLRIRPSFSKHCVFAVHDILTDPPFSKLDLVSCHNPEIFAKDQLEKVVPILHFALKPEGFLATRSCTKEELAPWFGATEMEGIFVRQNVPRTRVIQLAQGALQAATRPRTGHRETLSPKETPAYHLQDERERRAVAEEELAAANAELYAVNEEIQERNAELGDANTFLENIVQNINLPLLAVDGNMRITLFRNNREKIFNLIPKDIGRPVMDIQFRFSIGNVGILLLNAVETGIASDREIQSRSGRWYQMQIRPYLPAEGKPGGAIMVLYDIDAQKHAQEREQMLREQAESANQAKDEFLMLLSHELRTPLNAMLLGIKSLQSGQATAEQHARGLEILERNVKAQTRMVEDLLDISRISSGKLSLAMVPVDIRAQISAAVEIARPGAEAKSIELETRLEQVGSVLGDAGRLQQIIWNLVANAIKFSSTRGSVKVSLVREQNKAVILVEDKGEGIAPEFMHNVFNDFAQADTGSTRRHGGLGIGLALVRRLVEQHGGKVCAHSAGKGHGSRFQVTLPLLSVSLPDERILRHFPTNLKGIDVVLGEDDASTRDCLARILEHSGATVRAAQDAAEVERVVRERCPDVLICDIAMPGRDGWELMRKLRVECPKLPAVALSAYASADDQHRSLDAGFQAHLSKPVDLVAITKTIWNVLGRNPPGK